MGKIVGNRHEVNGVRRPWICVVSHSHHLNNFMQAIDDMLRMLGT